MYKIKDILEYSIIGKMIKYINNKVKKSVILNKISKDNINEYTFKSNIITFVENILNPFIYINKKIKDVIKEYLKNSIVGYVLNKIYNNITYLLGMFVVFFLIIPDNRWNNWILPIFIVLILIFYTMYKNIFDNKKVMYTKIDISFYLITLVFIISTIFSTYRFNSVKTLIFYITAILLTNLMIDILDNKKNFNTFIKFIIIGIFITSLYALYQWKIQGISVNLAYTDVTNNEGMPGRVYSTMENPNNYAQILLLTLPLIAYMFLHSKKIYLKVIYFVISIPILLSLLLTSSRAVWGALFIAFVLFLIFRYPKYLPLLIILLLVSINFIPDWVINRVLSIFRGNDASIGYRGQIFTTSLPLLKDYFTSGVGIGTRTYINAIKHYPIYTKAIPIHTHNVYVQMLAEVGIVGVIVFIYMMFRNIKGCLLKVKKVILDDRKDILVILMVTLVGILIVGSVEYILFYHRVMYMIFILLGLIQVQLNILEDKQ